jgi:drug/metabolite transporter (DMT)-like permease
MPSAVVLYGLLAALLAGAADFLAALVGRKLGSFLTLLYMIASSAALLLLAQAWAREPAPAWGDALALAGVAVAAAVGYLAFYRGLAVGPVGVVAPIAACDGAVAALLGLALAGGALGGGHVVAIALLVAGVALAAGDLRDLRSARSRGPLLAVVTMFGFGVALAGLGALSRRSGTVLMPVLVLRCAILLQLTAAAGLRRRSLWAGASAGLLLAAAGVGLLDTASLLAFARGALAESAGGVALLGPLYGAYPAVTVLLGRLFLKEKLAVNQWLGVALLLGGIVVISSVKGA